MYVSGENILFSAMVYHKSDLSAEEISRTLYCELIAPDGKKIAARKFGLFRFSAGGAFPIPEEAVSGIYYLRFYTRIMRNNASGDYKYILLKIVNPFKTEVLPGSDMADTINFAGREMVIPAASPALKITGQTIVAPRQEVHMEVQRKSDPARPVKLCLSVIPEFTSGSVPLPDRKAADPAKTVLCYPETSWWYIPIRQAGFSLPCPTIPGTGISSSVPTICRRSNRRYLSTTIFVQNLSVCSHLYSPLAGRR